MKVSTLLFMLAMTVVLAGASPVEACERQQATLHSVWCSNECGYSWVYEGTCEFSWFRYDCVYGGWAYDYCGRWSQPFDCWWDSIVYVEYYQTVACPPDPNV
ncbi:MAG: hypothetical protein Kow00109_11610 [Acidobacteriota bacterium]